jgi:hypothetical protein
MSIRIFREKFSVNLLRQVEAFRYAQIFFHYDFEKENQS